jgi:hypothetical protein
MINEQNGTLVANTVATVTFNNATVGEVQVINRDAAAEIWYTDDGTAPTVGGAGCYLVPAGATAKSIPDTGEANAPIVVKLISSGTPKYAVEILPAGGIE